MIDLINTCVLVRTKEENEMLLKEAEKQGFHWPTKNHCRPLPVQHFPDILKIYEDKDVTREAHIDPDSTFYEASELLGTKEMTAREFIEWFAKLESLCNTRKCQECVLYEKNTKCNKLLCSISNWENHIEEIIEIVKSGKFTIQSPEEKAIEDIKKLIQIPCCKITDEIKKSLKLAVEKIKEVK